MLNCSLLRECEGSREDCLDHQAASVDRGAGTRQVRGVRMACPFDSCHGLSMGFAVLASAVMAARWVCMDCWSRFVATLAAIAAAVMNPQPTPATNRATWLTLVPLTGARYGRWIGKGQVKLSPERPLYGHAQQPVRLSRGRRNTGCVSSHAIPGIGSCEPSLGTATNDRKCWGAWVFVT